MSSPAAMLDSYYDNNTMVSCYGDDTMDSCYGDDTTDSCYGDDTTGSCYDIAKGVLGLYGYMAVCTQ